MQIHKLELKMHKRKITDIFVQSQYIQKTMTKETQPYNAMHL